ncbi:MAG: hypothetical protein JSR40_11550 [Proteobacteria bacterium]|nr:hypothetical protein [Pseudomonadota bacterium]
MTIDKRAYQKNALPFGPQAAILEPDAFRSMIEKVAPALPMKNLLLR